MTQDQLRQLAAAAIVLVSVPLGFLVRHFLLARLAKVASVTQSRADDAIIASLRRPLPLWSLLVGLYLASRVVVVSPELAQLFDKGLLSAFIVSATFWAALLVSRLLQLGIAVPGQAPAPATGAVRYLAKLLVVALGALVLLSTLGISVTPVLTTFGIGGLAVALGLQDTLGNLFAGMQITLSGNLRVGDFIKLESGEQGYVDDIHWRATRVRTLANNFVLIPNRRLAQSVVTNYHRPTPDLLVAVEVGVHYSSDLERVEQVALRVAAEVMKSAPGGVPTHEPTARYQSFGDSSITLTIVLSAKEFSESFAVKHAFIKALARAFAEEKIVIPYPIRALNLTQEQQGKAPSPSGG